MCWVSKCGCVGVPVRVVAQYSWGCTFVYAMNTSNTKAGDYRNRSTITPEFTSGFYTTLIVAQWVSLYSLCIWASISMLILPLHFFVLTVCKAWSNSWFGIQNPCKSWLTNALPASYRGMSVFIFFFYYYSPSKQSSCVTWECRFFFLSAVKKSKLSQ